MTKVQLKLNHVFFLQLLHLLCYISGYAPSLCIKQIQFAVCSPALCRAIQPNKSFHFQLFLHEAVASLFYHKQVVTPTARQQLATQETQTLTTTHIIFQANVSF